MGEQPLSLLGLCCVSKGRPIPCKEAGGKVSVFSCSAQLRWLLLYCQEAGKRDEPRAALGEAEGDSCIHSCFGVLCADDLAAKANVLIDPAELQAVTMDDLDEDEESATSAAQVSHVPLLTCGGPGARAASSNSA